MRNIIVKVHPSIANLRKEDQLAWKIAEIASDKAKINKDALEMVINRIIDNASVAIASYNRKPVVSARQMACLLYTSPSPRDQRGSRMPASA